MGEAFARNAFLANRGVPLIDASNDLCPGNVGGHIVAFKFFATLSATNTGKVMSGVDVGGLTTIHVVSPKAGSIVGLALSLNTAMTASDKGAISAQAWKGTTNTGVAVALSGVMRKSSTWVNKDSSGTAIFAAGQYLKVKLVASSTVATALTAQATLFVEM
jgi:hypothetical protein